MNLICRCGHKSEQHTIKHDGTRGCAVCRNGCIEFEFDPSAESRATDAESDDRRSSKGEYEYLDPPDWR